eukprot:4206794-Amphidinium_carterae.1
MLWSWPSTCLVVPFEFLSFACLTSRTRTGKCPFTRASTDASPLALVADFIHSDVYPKVLEEALWCGRALLPS